MTSTTAIAIPVGRALYTVRVPSELLTPFARYAVAWSAMSWRRDAHYDSPGGVLGGIAKRWSQPGFDPSASLAQMAGWLEHSQHLLWLETGQVVSIGLLGACSVQHRDGQVTRLPLEATPRQMLSIQPTLLAILGMDLLMLNMSELLDNSFEQILDRHDCDPRHVREYLALCMRARLIPHVTEEQVRQAERDPDDF